MTLRHFLADDDVSPAEQAEILALLHELCDDDDSMSLLLVTHDWGVVADIADRVIVMRHGQLVEEAPSAQIFREPQHPHTRAMLAADPARLAQSEAESSCTEPNAYEKAAAARNQRRNDVGHRSEVKRRADSQPQARPRRRRRR